MEGTDPTMTWVFKPPKKKAVRDKRRFTRKVALESAIARGFDRVEIRSLPHKTTIRAGVHEIIQNHVTLHWCNLNTDNVYEMVEQGELFVDDENSRALQDDELDAHAQGNKCDCDKC